MPGSSSNISKSVGRAFALLELFAERRSPMTAAAIRNELNLPQPSVRALLKNLQALGYLRYESADRSYFPTARLTTLGDWITDSVLPDRKMRGLIDELAADIGETVSLSVRRGLRLEVLHATAATHPVAVQLQPGLGESLWRTAAGRTLLAAMPRAALKELLATAAASEREAIRKLGPLLGRIRKTGSYCAYDLYLRGVGAICIATMLGSEPAVIAIAGIRDRVRGREKQIEARVRRELRRGGREQQPAGMGKCRNLAV